MNDAGEKDEEKGIVLIDFAIKQIMWMKDKKIVERCGMDEMMKDDKNVPNMIDILSSMREKYEIMKSQSEFLKEKEEKINMAIQKAKELGDLILAEKATKMREEMEWKRKSLSSEYNYFYNRLKSLQLIDGDDIYLSTTTFSCYFSSFLFSFYYQSFLLSLSSFD